MPAPAKIARTAAFYLGLFLLLVAGLCLTGALLGAGLYTVGGLLLGLDRTPASLAAQGAREIAFWLGVVWGPGLSIVLCVMHAWRRHGPKDEAIDAS